MGLKIDLWLFLHQRKPVADLLSAATVRVALRTFMALACCCSESYLLWLFLTPISIPLLDMWMVMAFSGPHYPHSVPDVTQIKYHETLRDQYPLHMWSNEYFRHAFNNSSHLSNILADHDLRQHFYALWCWMFLFVSNRYSFTMLPL